MSIVLNGTTGITTPDIESTTSTLGPLTQALNLGSTGQIVFPATQNPSANANTLDDYEEGTFTPTDGSGAGLTFGASTSARYVKIGQRVFCDLEVAYPATGSVATARIAGFPFASASGLDYSSCSVMNDANLNLWAFSSASTTSIIMYYQSAGFNQVNNSTLSNKTVYFSISYTTAS